MDDKKISNLEKNADKIVAGRGAAFKGLDELVNNLKAIVKFRGGLLKFFDDHNKQIDAKTKQKRKGR